MMTFCAYLITELVVDERLCAERPEVHGLVEPHAVVVNVHLVFLTHRNKTNKSDPVKKRARKRASEREGEGEPTVHTNLPMSIQGTDSNKNTTTTTPPPQPMTAKSNIHQQVKTQRHTNTHTHTPPSTSSSSPSDSPARPCPPARAARPVQSPPSEKEKRASPVYDTRVHKIHQRINKQKNAEQKHVSPRKKNITSNDNQQQQQKQHAFIHSLKNNNPTKPNQTPNRETTNHRIVHCCRVDISTPATNTVH